MGPNHNDDCAEVLETQANGGRMLVFLRGAVEFGGPSTMKSSAALKRWYRKLRDPLLPRKSDQLRRRTNKYSTRSKRTRGKNEVIIDYGHNLRHKLGSILERGGRAPRGFPDAEIETVIFAGRGGPQWWGWWWWCFCFFFPFLFALSPSISRRSSLVAHNTARPWWQAA